MAQHKSAKKRIRRNEKKRQENKSRMSRVRTLSKKVDLALEAGDAKAAEAAFKSAQPEIQRAAGKGLLHKNTAARKLSRLAARIKKIKQAA